MQVTIRDATTADVAAITTIFNEVIATSDAIWREEPVSSDDRRRWFEALQEKGYPVLVAEAAEASGEHRVVGYLSLSDFRPFPGYWPTLEQSIHLAPAARNHGVGAALVGAAVERARAMGRRCLVAGTDAENTGSIRFHERLGYREVGRLPGVGERFGRTRDLVLLQLDLDAPRSPRGETT